MVGLSALWHLLGAVYTLTDLGPAALVAGVAVLLVVAAFALVSTRPGTATTGRAAIAATRPERHPVPVRCADPDAPGRSRPRAPSAVNAAA
jgi:hypothetical protein